MFDKLINGLASYTKQTKNMLDEVAEMRTIKAEINKARCVIEFSAEGNITSVNALALNALHFQERELLNQHHRVLLGTTESTSAEYQDFWRNLSAGKSQTGLFKLQSKEGGTVWCQGYYAPVLTSEGQLRKVVCYLTDVTAEKEKVLGFSHEDEALNKSFGLLQCDLEGRILDCNDIFLKSLGYTKAELAGKNITTILSREDAQSQDYKHMWEQLAKGELQVKQVKRITKDGRELWFQVNYAPVKDAQGNAYKVMVYSVCITAEKIKNADYQGQLAAISKIQGVIELDLMGKILAVNANLCKTTGYTESEMLGNEHSLFVDAAYKSSPEYKAFWEKLARGEGVSGVFKRLGKGGKEIWLQETYNPILDLNGKPYKVVNYATDVTKYKMLDADNEGQLSSIDRALGSIEFALDGKITKVNKNFASVTGYSAQDLVGNHHSILVDGAYKASPEYKALWDKLNHGEFDAGTYKLIGKDGKEIWLQASYNPILDLNGKPYKIIKFAIDITAQHNSAAALESAVDETQAIIEGAKAGDLTGRVSLEGKTGAIGSLCDGVNALLDKMGEVIMQVRDAGETINTAAGEISSGNNDLSSRTEQQASSLEETASSMEELASTVKQNAENAKQANQLAAAASGVAVKGGQVVNQVITTMSDINSSSRKIEDIISVIDGIAFQTNILALNAAVEAARAGEQGRGFAVVAAEVRNLAQRSAGAAKEIKQLISDSVAKVQDGSRLVEDAGKTMGEIVSSVQRVTDIMGEITAASVEQSSGIDQVNHAITSMDEVTQQNAALVEEAAAAAESLVEQAVSLMETVSGFKLNGGTSFSAGSKAISRPAPGQSHVKAVTRASSPRAVAKPATVKAMAKTGTDDSGDWEEF